MASSMENKKRRGSYVRTSLDSSFSLPDLMSFMDSGTASKIVNSQRRKLGVKIEGRNCIGGSSGSTSGITTSSSAATTTTTTGRSSSSSSSSIAASATGIISRRDDNTMVATVHSTTHQVRPVLDRRRANWKEDDPCKCQVKYPNGTSRTVNNYSIVASKGELSRNNWAEFETPAPSVVSKRISPVANERIHAKSENSLCYVHIKASRNQQYEGKGGSRNSRNPSRVVPKSAASVLASFREGFSSKTRPASKVSEQQGILKRSSAFFASLANHSRPSEKSIANGHRHGELSNPRYSTLKGYLSILTGGEDELFSLRRDPSVQSLTIEPKKKKVVSIKKSVSFSSDTSFEEKRAPLVRRAAVHEAKVYRKGVLQDSERQGENSKTKVPPSFETPSEGPAALLRAAREADDALLKEIITRARKSGLRSMDVNLTDSSGRTAISYMAGNGTSAMLELALSFDGADPNLPDNEGNTPLHFAAQAGQTECLNILLQRCPDIEVDARNTLGFTPLMKAALQGRTKCAKILLFAGANPTLRDHGRGLRAEQWARFCGRYVCAEVIERFARHRLLERTTSCRWGSEPELAAKVLQGKLTPIPMTPLPAPSTGLKSKIRKVFRTTSGPDRTFSLVSQLTSAALCASSPALPKPGDVPPVVKSLLRPLSVPQLRVTLVSPQDFLEKTAMVEKYGSGFAEKIENVIVKPPRTKKKNK